MCSFDHKSCLLLQELESWGARVLQMPSTECENLYGRCGYINALLFARNYVGPRSATQRLIKQLLQQIVQEGHRGAAQLVSINPNSNWNLMWSWHGSYYFGGDALQKKKCFLAPFPPVFSFILWLP